MNYILFSNIGVIDYLLLAVVLFTIGICGLIINRKNIITVLMSIELMLLAVNLNFVTFSVALQDYAGQIFAVFVLAVAAAEAAIGLAILVVYSRNKGNIDIENVNILKG